MTALRRQTLLDLAALTAVGVPLTTIHFLLPPGLQAQLAFDYERFTVWTILTGAYVHTSTQHLLGNLLGYGVGAGIAYTLCDKQDRRRWFWTTTAAFLLVLPVLVNLTSYAVFQNLAVEPISRGFSGIVAGYVGFVLVALARGIADRHGRGIAREVGQGIFILLLGEIAVIYTGVPSVELSLLLVVGVALSLGRLGLRSVRREWQDDERREVVIEVVFVTTVVALMVVFVWALFPSQIVDGDTTTNIIAHGAGFLWGGVIAAIVTTSITTQTVLLFAMAR